MKVFLTGIPGTDSRAALKELVRMSQKKKKKMEIRSVADQAFKFADKAGYQIYDQNVLDTLPVIHELMRGGAFKEILKDLSNYDSNEPDSEHMIIDSHASLMRGGIVELLRHGNFINDLSPDMFVTIIDSPKPILNRLKAKKHPIWNEKPLNVADIVSWQNQEVNYTSIWAQAHKKPHYILHRDQFEEMLYRIIYHPEMELVYASFAMTNNSDPELMERTQKFVGDLKQYFNVFEPILVDVSELSDEERPTVFHHTVYSDLNWWVNQSSKVIAFHPKRIYTSGMNSEMLWAKMHTKTVWLVSGEDSPFTSYFMAHKVFKDEKTFFDHLKKSGYKKTSTPVIA